MIDIYGALPIIKVIEVMPVVLELARSSATGQLDPQYPHLPRPSVKGSVIQIRTVFLMP